MPRYLVRILKFLDLVEKSRGEFLKFGRKQTPFLVGDPIHTLWTVDVNFWKVRISSFDSILGENSKFSAIFLTALKNF